MAEYHMKPFRTPMLVYERLADFLLHVHHEGTVADDRFVDRLAVPTSPVDGSHPWLRIAHAGGRAFRRNLIKAFEILQ